MPSLAGIISPKYISSISHQIKLSNLITTRINSQGAKLEETLSLSLSTPSSQLSQMMSNHQLQANSPRSPVLALHHPFQLELRRLVDTSLLRDNPTPLAVESLNVLSNLIGNILDHPSEPKYRSIRPRNRKLKETLFAALSGSTILVHLGFRKRVVAFEEVFEYSCSLDEEVDMAAEMMEEAVSNRQKMKLAHGIIKEYLVKGVEKQEREARSTLSTRNSDVEYKHKILSDIQQDRETYRERQERLKQARALSAEASLIDVSADSGTPSSASPSLQPHQGDD